MHNLLDGDFVGEHSFLKNDDLHDEVAGLKRFEIGDLYGEMTVNPLHLVRNEGDSLLVFSVKSFWSFC